MSNVEQHAESMRKTWQQRPATANAWLGERQRGALAKFDQLGFPGKHLDAWRYADLRELASHYPEWLINQTAHDPVTKDSNLDIDGAIKITFFDGRFQPELSDELPAGVFAGSSEDIANQHPELIAKRWGALANDDDSGLISLNSAFAQASVLISIAANVELSQPLYLNFTGATSQSGTVSRILVDLAENSQATIIEHYSSESARIVNAVTEIECGPGSYLNYYKFQEDNQNGWHTSAQYASIAENARISTAHIDLGAELSRNELNIKLQGRHAQAECRGVFVANGTGYVETRICVEHAAPDTLSRERFRGILADQAKGVFNGRILVDKIAQKTSAELSNRNLLLSKGAEINTKPELEIYADDVKCAHGSTTGQLDEQALFYLRSRGISLEDARNLLIVAFASELVDSLGIPSLSEKIRTKLRQLGATAL
jgi:Fe-S cluster assembly protein SufD